MQLALDRMEDIEHAKFQATAQLLINAEAGIEAFNAYVDIAFPSLAAKREQETKDIKARLKKAVQQGPLAVTAQQGATKKASRRIARAPR